MKIENIVCKGKVFTDAEIESGSKIGNDLSNDHVYEMYCDGFRVFLIEMGHFALVEFPDLGGSLGFDVYGRDDEGKSPRDRMIEAIIGVPKVEEYFDYLKIINDKKKEQQKILLEKKKTSKISNTEVENILHGIFQGTDVFEDGKVKITIDKEFLIEMEEELERFQDMELYDKFLGYSFEIKHDYGSYDHDGSVVTYDVKMTDTHGNVYSDVVEHTLMFGHRTSIMDNPIEIHEF